MNRLTTAYAGSADISPENVEALMNQVLPDPSDPLGYVYIPEKIVKRAQPGLAKVVHWLQTAEDGVGVEGTIPVPNLVAALLERNEKLAADGEEPDDLALVMVYNPASGLDVSLAEEAHAAGIRVINLSAAGDDLTFEDKTPAEPEVPAAEEQPPWEGEPVASAEAAEKPAEVPATPSPAETVQAATAAGVAAAEAVMVPAPSGGVTITFHLSQESVDGIAAAIVAAMSGPAKPEPSNVIEHPTAGRLGSRLGSTDPSDVAGQPAGTKPYYYNADKASYRPARGRARMDEERVFLSPEEVDQAKAAGRIA